jgi:hypothetical protein
MFFLCDNRIAENNLGIQNLKCQVFKFLKLGHNNIREK